MPAEIIFGLSVALIAYVIVGYPALMFVLSRWRSRPVRKADITPKVSFIIAAHNEEADIAGAVRAALDMVDRTITTASTKEEP